MKSKSFLLKRAAAVAAFFVSMVHVSVAQDVQVLLRPKMDPMPPQVMNYIGNPGNYFEVSLTNTSSEVQNVFLTMEVSKQAGGELSVTTPYYIQPNKAITLVPGRLTTIDQVTMLGQFRQLLPKDITLKGAEVSDFYDNGVIGLLPEGTYQAHVKVYQWDPAVKYPQLVSDPLQGKCTFSVCYNASAPEILVPLYNSLELSQNAVGTPKPETPGVVSDANDAKWHPAILDPTKAQFVWSAPVINCGGKVRSYKYQLDIFPIGTAQTTAEEAVATGTIAKTVKNLVAPQCIISEAEVTQMKKFSPTGYFVARVTATPTVTDKANADYSTIENNGHSQLLVFRLKQEAYDKGGSVPVVVPDEEESEEEEIKEEKKEEDKKVEVDPGYKEPEKNDDKKYVYYPPKLTAPAPFKGNVIKADGDIKLAWEKPVKKSGGDETMNFTYTVQLFKKRASQSIDSMLVSKPLFEEKSLSATNYTLRWSDIKDKVKLNDNLVVAVVPVCLNESSIGYDNEDERNLYRGSYVTGETGKLIDCDPDAGKSITNRTLANFTEKELRDLEVMVGQFPLTIENANLVDGDHYEGRGYITWKPMGDLPFKINVSFDKLYINSDKIVYDGEVVSAKEEESSISDYIPYDMFDDLFLADLIGAGTAEAYGDKLFDYIENNQDMAKYCEYAREVAPIIDDIIKGQVTVNLPVSLTKLIPSCPVDIQIMSGRWSPTNASVSIIGMFSLPESSYTDSQVAVFGLPRLCIEPDSFVPTGATMALLSDVYIKDPSTQFVFTLKAPSDLQKMDDGCSISFTNKGFQELNFEADMEIPGLIKADEKGERLRGQRPHIDVKAKIKDWDNWIGQLKMDNFEVEEAPGFTFCPSGDGLIYDHSMTDNGKGFKFPEPIIPQGGIDKNLTPKTYDKTQLGITSDKENVKWQGLYLDKIGVWLPPIFKQGDGNNRIEVAMKQFLWDDSGVSLTISAAGTNGGDLIGIETGKLGGWGISLHEVGVSVIQGDFGCTYFTGMVKAPLIGGKWNYSTSFDKIDKGAGGSNLRILFHMQPEGDPEFDFFLANVKLDEKYTHLDVQYIDTETDDDKKTKVELEMAGHITIAGTEEVTEKLSLDISGVAFTGMRVANFEKPKDSNNKSDAQAMKFSHTFEPICEGPNCWFDLGTWGLASAEKTLGPFKFSLDNFGVDKKDDMVGVNIVGTIGLVGDVFSATAGVTVWAKVDLDKMDIDYDKTTLDKIGLSTEFGGCKVAGMLEFVDKDENGTKVKGYGGTLEFNLPGGLFKLQAAGGFFNASDNDHGKFSSAYFLAGVGGATGIPIGPVQLNDISGGFFFHTALDMKTVEANAGDVTKWKTSVKYGVHGGMFGLGISTVGSDRGINAKVRMTVLYDAVRNKLSTFRMTGDIHALCVSPQSDDGMINGKCCIVYQNMPEKEGGKYFQINITADAGGDMDKLYKEFTGQDFVMPEALGDLQEMGDQGNQKSKDAKDSKPKISCGVNISLDFKVTMKPDDNTDPKFKSKWHLYVGQPGDGSPTSMMKDRCSITFIDFQVGSKTGKVAAWCKQWANAYLCIGNELPGGGKLPPIPEEIEEFLNGKKQDSHLTDSKNDKTNDVKNQQDFQKKKFESKGMKSGVMFGAQVGGEWGVRAVVCYAEATLLAGFDVVLGQLEDRQCNGKPAGGKGGFYGQGQVYAMAKGEMGLIIDLWIYKGDWSLISVGVGALLKGGFPNPSWLYGKVRATCKLFGGLIKFNGSLTFELGDVCFPDAGNPLDDIKIFEDMTPGTELTGTNEKQAAGWSDEPISCFATAGFTTNMKIGTRLDLMDENTANRMAGKDGDPAMYANNAMRSYKFYLQPTGTFESWADNSMSKDYRLSSFTYKSSDQEAFTYVIEGGMLDPNRYYRVTQKGYCKEIRNGKEENPYMKKGNDTVEKPYPWEDPIVRYFRTGSLPNNLMEGDQIAMTLPQKAGGRRFYRNEMENPQIHMKVDRTKAGDDIFNTSKYKFMARFEKNVNGNWVPVDAVVRVDTYKSGKDYYYVDEYGNVDYTIKVNSLGQVIATQIDPFETGNGYDKNSYSYLNKKYTYLGVNRERVQRFTAELNSAIQLASEKVDASKKAYYYPLKWIPTGFNSIEKAIEYYQAMINSETKSTKNALSSVTKALDKLKADLTSAMKDGSMGSGRPMVNDTDIRYVYQGAGTVTPGAKSLVVHAKDFLQEIYDKMQRCLNDGEVYLTQYGKKTTYANRHQLPLEYYKLYIENYDKEMGYALTELQSNGFNIAPTTQELNDLKTLYLQMAIPYSKIKADYDNAVKVETVLARAKTQRDNVKNNYTKDIRNPKNGLNIKKSRLNSMNGFLKNYFDGYRKEVGIYPEYKLSKEVIEICDAFNDSLNEMTKFVAHYEAVLTINEKLTVLENLLKQVNDYMDKTPESSRSYSYVKSNYYKKAIDAFETAQKATNNGREFERAKTAYDSIEIAIFSSEKMTLEYAREQKTLSNSALSSARTAASSAITAVNNVIAEEGKTSPTNDNSARVQELVTIEQTKFADAYNAANDVADIATAVQRYTARHTGEMNKTPGADQMRQIVKDCRDNADAAMKSYKDAINKATVNRVKRFTSIAMNNFFYLRSTMTKMMSETNTTRLNSYYNTVQDYAKTIDDALTSANAIKSDHIYASLIRDIKNLVDNHFKHAASYLRYPGNSTYQLYVANYLNGAAGKAKNFAASTNPALQDYNYADYMATYAEAASKMLKGHSDKRTAAKYALLTTNRDKVSSNLYNMRYYTGKMLTENNQNNLNSRFNSVKELYEELKTLAQNSGGIDNNRLEYIQIVNDKALAAYYYNAALYLKERKGKNASYMVNIAMNLCNAAESAKNYAAATASNVQDASYASHMASIAEDANKHIKGYTFNASLNSSQRSSYNNYKSRAASAATAARTAANNKNGKKYVAPATTAMYSTQVNEAAEFAKKAREEANKKKGKSLTMDETMPTAMSPATPLYAEAQYRSTVPGVAEAYELMAMETPKAPSTPKSPETPETPDGPAGAAVVAKVAGMMNASMPKPKPKPEVPAESVISSASTMLNAGTNASFGSVTASSSTPGVPSTPDVSGVPASNPYSSATDILSKAYNNLGKTNIVTSNTSGATMHVDMNSLKNSKLATIPVTFNKSGNFHWLQVGVDMYKTVVSANTSGFSDYNYRVVVMQVDQAKFDNAMLEAKKEIETSTEEAKLNSTEQSYLSQTGTDGTNNNSDSYSLQSFLANYYKEMEEQGLMENEGEAQKTKLKKKNINLTTFASEIYEWKIDFKPYLIQDDFNQWANSTMKPNGTSTSSSYHILDSKLEGVRPTKFTYNNTSYSPASLVGYSDATLLNNLNYVLYDPYVWLAYMGGYALFNGRKISSKSGYWDKEFISPAALKVSFPVKSGWYRGRKNGSNIVEHSIGYTNRGQWIHVTYTKNGQQYMADYELDKDGNYTHASGWKKYKTSTEVYNYYEASDFIKAVAVGYQQPSYNDCLYKNIGISNTYQHVYTAVHAIQDMLTGMHELEDDLRYYYYQIWGLKKDQIKSHFSKWNTSNTRAGNDWISCPAIQAGFIYQSEYMVDKGEGDWDGYFPGYPNRFYYGPDQIALSINNYTNKKGGYSNYNFRFRYDWYCNNLKSVTNEFYRCNGYDIKKQEYTVRNNTNKYTKTLVWDYPLKNYTSGWNWFNGDFFPVYWK